MNEFVTDLENSAESADEWISSSASSVGTAIHEAGDGISAFMGRGRKIYKAVGKRVGKEADAANVVLHNNPYPAVLVGIGAGAILGFFVACRLSGKCS